jgi:hypothetical protein
VTANIPDEQLKDILDELNKHLFFAHIHRRKEIENYLLAPDVLERALHKGMRELARAGVEVIEDESILKILERITKKYRKYVQAQFIGKRNEYLKSKRSKKNEATIAEEAIEEFERKWKDINTRLEIVPGKEVLSDLRNEIQTKYKINLTDYKIIDEFRESEISPDLLKLLSELEAYRLIM